MSQIENITEIPGIPGILGEFENKIQAADPHLPPQDPESMRSLLKKTVAQLKDLIDGHNGQTVHEIEISQIERLKVEAEVGFHSAKETLVEVNESFYETGQVDTIRLLAVLLGYASGYHLYTQLCSDRSPVDVVERWNAANQGNQVNCPQLVTSQNDFIPLVNMSLAPSTMTNPHEAKSDHEMYGRFDLNPNNRLERSKEFEDFGTDYAQWSVALGYQRSISRHNWPDWLVNTGPLAEIGLSRVTGSDINLGSHRNQFEFRVGWKQPLYRWNFTKPRIGLSPLISPKLGLGYAQNWLNFGRGFPLEKEPSWMFLAHTVGGLEFDWNSSAALFISAGYFYDRTIKTSRGLDPFSNQGWVAELGASWDLP